MALIKGWILSFDSERFELVVFSLSDRTDPETSWARAKSDIFVGGPKTLSQWVAAMREQNCEILLYPAVGLNPMTLKLASLRLAPVQINAWGHPDTSGLPTLDYYVSADCFEPADAQDHYSERLILLPHLGNRIQPLNIPTSDPELRRTEYRSREADPGLSRYSVQVPTRTRPCICRYRAKCPECAAGILPAFRSGPRGPSTSEDHPRIRSGRSQRDGPRAIHSLAEFPRVSLPPQARRCDAGYHRFFRLQHGGASDRVRPAAGDARRAVLARAPGERCFAADGLARADRSNQEPIT